MTSGLAVAPVVTGAWQVLVLVTVVPGAWQVLVLVVAWWW
jgi:hypothetical protein